MPSSEDTEIPGGLGAVAGWNVGAEWIRERVKTPTHWNVHLDLHPLDTGKPHIESSEQLKNRIEKDGGYKHGV